MTSQIASLLPNPLPTTPYMPGLIDPFPTTLRATASFPPHSRQRLSPRLLPHRLTCHSISTQPSSDMSYPIRFLSAQPRLPIPPRLCPAPTDNPPHLLTPSAPLPTRLFFPCLSIPAPTILFPFSPLAPLLSRLAASRRFLSIPTRLPFPGPRGSAPTRLLISLPSLPEPTPTTPLGESVVCGDCKAQRHENCPGGTWCDCQCRKQKEPKK